VRLQTRVVDHIRAGLRPLAAPHHRELPSSSIPRANARSAVYGGQHALIDHARKIPSGPTDAFDTEQDLLAWIEVNFKKYGDLYRATVFGKNVYVASSPEYAQHVLRNNWENYRKGQAIKRVAMLLGNGLMVSEGDFWKKQRRMIQPAFHLSAVTSLYEVMKVANLTLLRKWENSARRGETINVTSDTSLLVLEITLRAMFGEDYSSVAPFFNLLHDEPARNLRFAQAFAETRQVVVKLMERRLRDKSEGADILRLLMNARGRGGGSMPEEQVVKETMTIVVAGHETTAGTLNMIWYLLSQNPEAEMRLSEELSDLTSHKFPDIEALPNFAYTRLVIDEALRLYPPGWLMTRRAIEDDYLGEYYVPAGTEVYISPYIIQRHPELWVKPDSFYPERFNSAGIREKRSAVMLPFSVGPRNCIGEVFARTEMQVHLMIVASRIRLRYAKPVPLEFEAGVNLRSKHAFMMSPEVKRTVAY
jgi:cytochrome P450